jgi:hypothetical protein
MDGKAGDEGEMATEGDSEKGLAQLLWIQDGSNERRTLKLLWRYRRQVDK